MVEGKDGGLKSCRQDRSLPQVTRNQRTGEEVGYGVGVPSATCRTRGVRGEAYCSTVIVQPKQRKWSYIQLR